jgi:hypothetical protein
MRQIAILPAWLSLAALLPLFATADYTTNRFSSSIMSSLVSGTPLLANAEFLAAYTFFNASTVYPHADWEALGDAMLRLLRAPTEELLKVQRRNTTRAEPASPLLSNSSLYRRMLSRQACDRTRGAPSGPPGAQVASG